jgi:hypothetical protein
VIVVLIAKFTEGAWITLLLIPGLILLMRLVRRHYDRVAKETDYRGQLNLRDAMSISPEVRAVHVEYDQESDVLASRWEELVKEPARRAGLSEPPLIVLQSRYRFVIRPILDYVLDLERRLPTRQIAVLTPELVERRWYLNLLHNHRSAVFKALLLFQGDKRITVINIPWYLSD